MIDGHTISVTAAVGVSTSEAVDPAAPDAAAMLHEADRAMYEQNSGGRKTADGRHNWRRGRHCPAGRVGAPRREPDAWLMALCPEHHERITIAFRAARRRLFFRTSSFDVT